MGLNRWVFLGALLASGCGGSEPGKAAASDVGIDSGLDVGIDSGTDVGVDSGRLGDVGATPDSGSAIPIGGASLLPWLQSKAYLAWPAESKVHASTGPHGGNVRTFITPSLEASLKSVGAEHPMGVAMVKELYGSGSTEITGWAVATKIASSSAKGDNWYWYEIIGTSTVADGNGVPLCKNCHAGGNDFVLTPYPLR